MLLSPLPLWVIRVQNQVITTLLTYEVNESDRENTVSYRRLRNRVKICCISPSGKIPKVTVRHSIPNTLPLVELENITIEFNRYIRTRQIS